MVCLGNICRSPTAEAALVEALQAAGLDGEVEVDSAGTGDWHLGDPPDPRMVRAAAAEGLTLRGRARKVTAADFRDFDLLLAADGDVRDELLRLAPDDAARAKVRLFRDFEEARRARRHPRPVLRRADGLPRRRARSRARVRAGWCTIWPSEPLER